MQICCVGLEHVERTCCWRPPCHVAVKVDVVVSCSSKVFHLYTMASKSGGLETTEGAVDKKVFQNFPFQRAQKSPVWNHFLRTGECEATCKFCEKKLVYRGGTTSLHEHLKRVHPSKAADCVEVKNEPGTASATGSMMSFVVSSRSNRKGCSSATASTITDMIVAWLAADLRPLSIVGDDGFKAVLNFLMPDYIVPSRTHISSLIRKRHKAGKDELAALKSTRLSLR